MAARSARYWKDLRTFLPTLLLCVVTSIGWDKGIFGICTFHIIPFFKYFGLFQWEKIIFGQNAYFCLKMIFRPCFLYFFSALCEWGGFWKVRKIQPFFWNLPLDDDLPNSWILNCWHLWFALVYKWHWHW